MSEPTRKPRFKDSLNMKLGDHWKEDGYLLPFLSMCLFLATSYFLAKQVLIHFQDTMQSFWGAYFVPLLTLYLPLDLGLNLFFIMCYRSKSALLQKWRINEAPWPWEENYDKWIKQIKKVVRVYVRKIFFVCVNN